MRRFTGGGAVYQDLGNLNYTICTRKLSPSSSELQRSIFKLSLDCAIACLDILGIESSRIPVNTVVVRGQKISGGAGAIRWGAVLYHGSILVSTHLETVWKILRRMRSLTPRAFVQSTRLPVTSAKVELSREISVEEVQEALKEAFAKTFGAYFVPATATGQELSMVPALVKEKYGPDEWNLKM
jgi:lipoate-protein ligase A